MFASKTSSTSNASSNKPVKSLTTKLATEESKTPEIETVAELAQKKKKEVTPKKKSPKKSPKRSPKRSKQSPLSSRAQRVKQDLSKKVEVCAVLIKPDGSLEEISYNGSSYDANKILGGRPSIIGELEDIQVIIVRSLSQNSCGELNKFILPVPFCNKQFNGNYLLYRVDTKGNPLNLTKKIVEKYVADNKTLTEQARKNYDPVENQEIKIKTNSTFNSNSKLTMVYLRSEIDKKVRAELTKKNNGKKPSSEEVEKAVNIELTKFVDELVLKSNPMNDPDYDPKDDEKLVSEIKKIYEEETGAKLNNKDLAKQLLLNVNQTQNANEEELVDERDWRLQLNDALKYVRERGRVDGRILAEKISETFYELNGVQATLDQLVEIFRKIKHSILEEEAPEIDNNNKAVGGVTDNGSAYDLAQKLGANVLSSNINPSDLIDYALRIVKEDLIHRAKSSFVISKGRSPSKDELEETVQRLALKLAEEAVERVVAVETVGRDLNDIDLDENDGDYDPNNEIDKKLLKSDLIEDKEFDSDYFNLRMLTTQRLKSRGGRSSKYNVYFCKFDKKRNDKNLRKAIDSFKMRNKREPNHIEIEKLKKFISVEKTTNLVEFELSVVGGGDDLTDGGDEEEKSELLLKATKKGPTTPTKVLVTPVKKKKTAARYNVYFEDDKNKLNSNKNEKLAIKWFKRFNNRSPNELEIAGIKQFVKADKSQLTECEYQIPAELTMVGDDDQKDTEEDDNLLSKLKMKTADLSRNDKNKAMRYTLNFDDSEERANGDTKQALKWFKRFNNRNPTDSEIKKIKSFVKADKDDTVDID